MIMQVVDLTNSTVDPAEVDDIEVFRRTSLWHNLVYKNMVRHLLPVLTSQVVNRMQNIKLSLHLIDSDISPKFSLQDQLNLHRKFQVATIWLLPMLLLHSRDVAKVTKSNLRYFWKV